MYILTTLPVNARQKEKLLAAAAGREMIFCDKTGLIQKQLEQAEVILGNLADPQQARSCPNLKWLQLNNAGTEGYCQVGVLGADVILTNATGAYGPAISEHMLGCLFALRKKLHLYWDNQRRHAWESEGFVSAVEGTGALVIGVGDIGGAFARKLKALGCVTWGIRRRPGQKPAWLDGLYDMGSLEALLPKADIVAMSLPGNASTYRVLNRERIALLKPGAVVINVGRGTAIDTEALTEALYAGKIAGAALDVTDPEPLPVDHPLWDAPNALLTPHISGGFALPETLERIVDICADNLRRYLAGEELRNVIDRKTGYKRDET